MIGLSLAKAGVVNLRSLEMAESLPCEPLSIEIKLRVGKVQRSISASFVCRLLNPNLNSRGWAGNVAVLGVLFALFDNLLGVFLIVALRFRIGSALAVFQRDSGDHREVI